ncbi:glycine zipper 2TM domain-containing protein [Thioalbus denitrificans]|uniref:Glycine zipper 2TM protein n=1 Tax=Thioalbus denitrificans TaxID=547122 RepID=A0A369CFP1_9GAMM|nr:glycine zipper 2TM domain-containing protein [Thioalbus denitrificans]RCX32749.1 glycine zipper 2TM protein [Thioalbus denitrificans]
MKYIKESGTVLGLVGILALGACAPMASQNNAPNYDGASSQGNNYSDAYTRSAYGVVESIERENQGNGGIGGSGLGMGTVAGAVVGGVVGHQVGSGSGNTAATVIGAAGGAYVGHQLEKQQQSPDAYRITIRMEDGTYQSLIQATDPGLRVGDRVRIDNGVVRRY